MARLVGKTSIITGGSRGIGKAIAMEFAKEGSNVIFTYSKDEEGAQITKEEIEKFGVICHKVQSDIGSYEDSKKLVDEVIKKFGSIDILVNNAGISTIGLFMDQNEEQIDKMIRNNLTGPMYLTKCAIPHMVHKGGAILNISSMWGDVGASCEVMYSTTKGGINLFTKSLAKEMALSNIRINAIAPGVIDTKMNSFLGEDERKELEQEIPMGRFGKTEEIAKTAVFLCSEESSYITGQVIRVDGAFI